MRRRESTKRRIGSAWARVKDALLLILLLNVLIGVLQDVHFKPETIVFVRDQIVPTVDAESTPAPEPSSEPEQKKLPAIVTSYNADVEQTDSDPYTMANGKRVFEGAIASNCYPFGTKIEIVGVGDFVVSDRMNRRYTKDCGTEAERIDIFRFNPAENITIKNAEYIVK